MIELLTENFAAVLNWPLGKELLVILVSMLPFIELRGAIPLAIALGLSPLRAFLVAYCGSIIPVPIILIFLQRVFDIMRRFKIFRPLVSWLEARGEKRKDKVERLQYGALLLFAALPLPGTGTWCSSLVASVFDMKKKPAFLMISLGTFICAIIMLLTSLGVKWLLG